MRNDYDLSAPIINRDTAEHHCFGCGTLNEVGLKLAFRRTASGVWADLRPDRRFEGYVGMIHGGVLSAMLDEAMSWAITADGGFAVTARLNTSFKSPAPVGSHLRVEGRVVRQRRRLVDTEATIVNVDDGSVVADSEGRFMRVTDEQAEVWRLAYLDADEG